MRPDRRTVHARPVSRALIAVWAAALGLTLNAPPALAGGGGGGMRCVDSTGYSPMVAVADSCFFPKTATVSTGDPVTWRNVAVSAHNVTFVDLDAADGEPIATQGDILGDFVVRLNEPGRYAYYCTYHSDGKTGMAGTIVVEGKSAGGPTAEIVADGAFEDAEASGGAEGDDEADAPAVADAAEADAAPTAAELVAVAARAQTPVTLSAGSVFALAGVGALAALVASLMMGLLFRRARS